MSAISHETFNVIITIILQEKPVQKSTITMKVKKIIIVYKVMQINTSPKIT